MVTTGPVLENSEEQWLGVSDAARAAGCDLICFVGTELGRPDGLTKLIFEPETRRLLGAGIAGVNAGELIAETVHAIEMGADAEDIGLTIHPHPTLTESIGMAAEMAAGTITDLMPPRKRAAARS